MPELDNSARNTDTLEGLEAYLDSLEGDPNAALEKLAGKTDPDNVRRRLAILINSGRIEEAAAEARARQKSETWIDLAVSSLAATGAHVEAKEYVDWAKTSSKTAFWQRSAIGYYDASMNWILRRRAEGERIFPGTLNAAEQEILQRAAEVVEAACAPALATGRVDTELDLQLLLRLFDASYLLQSRERCRDIARLLETQVPIPLKVAQATLQKLADPVSNIVDRLWSEHGESFRSRFLACLIQARVLNNEPLALGRAYELVELAKSSDDKEDLCELLYELTNLTDPAALARARETATALLGEGSLFLKLMAANDLLRHGDAPGALSMVEASDVGSNPQGMRIKALAMLKIGKPLEALTLLQELANFTPDPWLFKMTSDVARKHNCENDEQEALERLLALAPGETNARQRLSWLYARKADYKRATRHLEILHEQVPDDVEATVNLAVSYSFDGQHERALDVLANAATGKVASLPIVKTRAQILHALGRSSEAFNVLESVRDNFWEDPHFLSIYLTVGHAANKEAQAHEALKKLLELKEKGLINDQLIRQASLDEMREIIVGAAKRKQTVQRFIIEGKFPWLLSAEMQHEALYWSWTLRTRPVSWLVDDAINRASYSIYATNGFRVLSKPNEAGILTEIKCAGKDETIVADASALITLHSLGLLERAAEYFGRVLVPASYLPKVISDMRQLFPHQLSQKTSAELIKASVDRKDITVQSKEAGSQKIPLLDEYQDEEYSGVRLYRLEDLLKTLHTAGLVTDAQLNQGKAVAHRRSTVTEKEAPLALGNEICIAEETLVTLAGIGWLNLVAKYFSVFISQEDLDQVIARIRAFQALDTAQSSHKSLWDSIQSNRRFDFVPVTEVLTISDEEEPDRGIAMAAYLTAKEKKLPLLVDDRVCQALRLNEWKEEPAAAFGTDSLVQEMARVGTLTHDEAADALLQLMAWRYRFILVPPQVLKLLAERYHTHPPGSALRKIAIYVHDCMRDEGLFAGLEATKPPVSIAIRLYQSWVHNISQFIMDVWLDETIEESHAQEITTWAITELLPSPPKVANERLQSTLALLTPRTAMTWALLRPKEGSPLERINRALRAMSSAFGLNDEEYLEIVAGVIGEI